MAQPTEFSVYLCRRRSFCGQRHTFQPDPTHHNASHSNEDVDARTIRCNSVISCFVNASRPRLRHRAVCQLLLREHSSTTYSYVSTECLVQGYVLPCVRFHNHLSRPMHTVTSPDSCLGQISQWIELRGKFILNFIYRSPKILPHSRPLNFRGLSGLWLWCFGYRLPVSLTTKLCICHRQPSFSFLS